MRAAPEFLAAVGEHPYVIIWKLFKISLRGGVRTLIGQYVVVLKMRSSKIVDST